MARFFFTQVDCYEMIVEEGKPMGGAVVATLVWMEALHALGHHVVLAKNENEIREIVEKYSWIETQTTYHPKNGIPMIRWVSYRLPKLFGALRKSNCDYLIESIPTWTSFFIGVICGMLSIQQILRVANDNMLDERIRLTHSKFEQFFINLAFRRAPFIMVQNQFQFKKLSTKFPNKKILKVSNPAIINQAFLSHKTGREGYIAWVANFRRQKNMELLFEIAALLPHEKFKIAGIPIPKLQHETMAAVEKLRQLPNVEFVGSIPREQILPFFSKAKFLLNTSHYEGFSNTFLEAMATGTPIVSSPNVNPDGIIDQYALGLLYTDQNDLKSRLTALTDSEYSNFSMNCIKFISEKHDHIALGKQLLNFLEFK